MNTKSDTANGGGVLYEIPASSDGLTQEVAFDVLSCRRRRHVLHCLEQRNEPVELRELSERIAAWENDVAADAVTYDQRMRVYTALRQSHLPKMDRAGVIEFDPDAGTAELTEEASELAVYLDVVPHDEIPWSTYYVGLGALSAGFVVVTWFGVVPFSLLPCPGPALVITALFTASAVAHRRHDRETKIGGEGDPPG